MKFLGWIGLAVLLAALPRPAAAYDISHATVQLATASASGGAMTKVVAAQTGKSVAVLAWLVSCSTNTTGTAFAFISSDTITSGTMITSTITASSAGLVQWTYDPLMSLCTPAGQPLYINVGGPVGQTCGVNVEWLPQ
jgi:hypothetical protein